MLLGSVDLPVGMPPSKGWKKPAGKAAASPKKPKAMSAMIPLSAKAKAAAAAAGAARRSAELRLSRLAALAGARPKAKAGGSRLSREEKDAELAAKLQEEEDRAAGGGGSSKDVAGRGEKSGKQVSGLKELAQRLGFQHPEKVEDSSSSEDEGPAVGSGSRRDPEGRVSSRTRHRSEDQGRRRHREKSPVEVTPGTLNRVIVARAREEEDRRRDRSDSRDRRRRRRSESRRRRRRRSSSRSSRSESQSSEQRRGENRLRRTTRKHPGKLFLQHLTGIRSFLNEDRGSSVLVDASGGKKELKRVYLRYFNLVVAHRCKNVRNSRELRTLSEVADLLIEGDLARGLDVIAQRYAALEVAEEQGSWKLAQHLELVPQAAPTSVGETGYRFAASEELRAERLRKALDKAKNH